MQHVGIGIKSQPVTITGCPHPQYNCLKRMWTSVIEHFKKHMKSSWTKGKWMSTFATQKHKPDVGIRNISPNIRNPQHSKLTNRMSTSVTHMCKPDVNIQNSYVQTRCRHLY